MHIAELSIRRPVTIIMAFVSMLVIGGIAALRLPLAEIARAHDLVEQGQVVGNVVLDIP